MTLKEEIAIIRARIAQAQTECDTWRASGMQEKYVESYCRVPDLELTLERLRNEGVRLFANYAGLQPSKAPDADPTAPMPAAQVVEGPDESQRRLMAELSITFRDGAYHFETYRYERLADAAAYACLRRTHGRPARRSHE